MSEDRGARRPRGRKPRRKENSGQRREQAGKHVYAHRNLVARYAGQKRDFAV